MTASTSAPSVANSALARAIGRPLGVLRRSNPSDIENLKKSFPDLAAFIEESRGAGIKLGGGPPNAEFVAVTWQTALGAAEREFENKLPQVKGRLESADRVELASQIIAALSGSTLLGLLVGSDSNPALRIVAAAVTFLGTASGLVARFFRRGIGGGSMIESYVSLTRLVAESKTLQVELSLWAIAGGEPAAKGDELSTRASRILTEMQSLLPSAG